MQTTRVNNKHVKAIPVDEAKKDKRQAKGWQLIPECYANVALVAKKKSGKTSVIYQLIKECVGRNTSILAFVSTLHKDDGWLTIQKYCEDRGVPFVGYTSLKDEGVDQLAALVEHLQEDEKDDSKVEDVPAPVYACVPAAGLPPEPETKQKPRKSKYIAPEYIIILDDLSDELKSQSVTALLKKNRHFKCKIIISTQWLNDIPPQSIKQLDVILLFKDHSIEKIEELHSRSALSVPLEKFKEMYQDATAKPYSFLFIDLSNNEYRRTFTDKYEL